MLIRLNGVHFKRLALMSPLGFHELGPPWVWQDCSLAWPLIRSVWGANTYLAVLPAAGLPVDFWVGRAALFGWLLEFAWDPGR